MVKDEGQESRARDSLGYRKPRLITITHMLNTSSTTHPNSFPFLVMLYQLEDGYMEPSYHLIMDP